jgi:glycosyltransferase involved in cell wall biosynthesis
MKKILYVFRRKRTERLNLYLQGLGPDEMLYGMNHLDRQEFAVDFIEGDIGQSFWWKKTVQRLEQYISKPIGMGFALDMILENLPRLKNADIIISTVDTCGLPIALLKRLGVIHAPILYFSQGLSDRVEALRGKSWLYQPYRVFYSWLLRACQGLYTLGKGAAQHLNETLDLRGRRVEVIPFGVDMEFWHSAHTDMPAGDYILSVGNDPARDYEVLVKAIGSRKLKIVTQLPVNITDSSKAIEICSDISDVELRALYQGARFVVTPLQDVTQPSGQSATLQAMACGKAVILTRTRGLWEPEYFKHAESVFLVEPGNSHHLTQALDELDENDELKESIARNALSLICSRYNSKRFARMLSEMILAQAS